VTRRCAGGSPGLNGATWCNVLQCVAVWFSALQCAAVYCSMLQCAAARCSALQCCSGSLLAARRALPLHTFDSDQNPVQIWNHDGSHVATLQHQLHQPRSWSCSMRIPRIRTNGHKCLSHSWGGFDDPGATVLEVREFCKTP